MKIDLRSAEGQALRPLLVPVARSLHGSGWTPHYIAEELGVATRTVECFLRDHPVRPQIAQAQDEERERWRAERIAQNRLDEERWEAEKFLLGRARADWEDIRARIRHKAAEKRLAKRVLAPMPQVVSLDAPARLPGGDGSTGHELIGDPRLDPAVSFFEDEYRSQRTGEILGDLQIEDVAHMDEAHLETLRERLLEEGLVSIAVQRGERERLRDPTRHRGEGLAPLRERKSSRHRGRKEQHALMTGKRTSRKQSKRWSREAA